MFLPLALLSESPFHSVKPLSRASLFPTSSVLAICMACTGLTPLLLPCSVSLAVLPWVSQFLLVSSLHPGSHFLACSGSVCVSVPSCSAPSIYEALGHLRTESGGPYFLSQTVLCSHLSPYYCKQDSSCHLGWRRKSGWWTASTSSLLLTVLFPGARSRSSWGWLS